MEEHIQETSPKPKRVRGPRRKASATEVTMTAAQLQDLLAKASQGGGDLKEALVALARELKAPDPEVAAKKAADKERQERNKAQRLAEVKAKEEGRLAAQAACEAMGHKKENGRSAIHPGQVYNDGTMRPFCLRCDKWWPPRKAAPEFMNA